MTRTGQLNERAGHVTGAAEVQKRTPYWLGQTKYELCRRQSSRRSSGIKHQHPHRPNQWGQTGPSARSLSAHAPDSSTQQSVNIVNASRGVGKAPCNGLVDPPEIDQVPCPLCRQRCLRRRGLRSRRVDVAVHRRDMDSGSSASRRSIRRTLTRASRKRAARATWSEGFVNIRAEKRSCLFPIF